jgi:hypothetical protein
LKKEKNMTAGKCNMMAILVPQDFRIWASTCISIWATEEIWEAIWEAIWAVIPNSHSMELIWREWE